MEFKNPEKKHRESTSVEEATARLKRIVDETSNADNGLASDPNTQLLRFKLRNETTELLNEFGVISALAKTDKEITTHDLGDWRANVSNGKLVSLVKKTTEIQKDVLTVPSQSTKNSDTLVTKEPVGLQTEHKKEEPVGVVYTKPEYTIVRSRTREDVVADGDRYRAKEAQKKQEIQAGAISSSKEVSLEEKQINAINGVIDDAMKGIPQTGSAVGKQTAETKKENPAINWDTVTTTGKNEESALNTSLEYAQYKKEQFEEIGNEYREAIKKSNERVEAVEEKLEKRRDGGLERLKNLGLTGVSKSLEAWKNANPKYKLALAAVLAGASVATGGLTSIIQKGLSSLTYGSTFYQSELKAKQEAGEEVNKGTVALKSLALGVVAALATSMVVSEIFSHVNVPDVLDKAGEKIGGIKDSIKGFFGGLFDTAPVDGVIGTPPEVAPIEGIIEVAPLGEYVIESGDNLTSIIKDEILSTIPDAENLSDFQKENMIQNLLNIAADNKDMKEFATINQFAKPDHLIQPGQKLDLEAIKNMLTTFKMGEFDNETLLEHAKQF